MPWGAAIAAVGAVGGAAISSSASKSAGDQQADAARNAQGLTNQQFEETRQDQAPWRDAGQNALSALQYRLGLGPQSGGGVAQSAGNFDPQAYLAANPDVVAEANNPDHNGGRTPGEYALWHYQNYGQGEGRQFTLTPGAQAQVAAAGTGGAGATSGTGTYGDLLKNFSMADYTADPGYQFRQDQGEKAINRSALAAGRYNSGATLKSLDSFNSGLASQEYGNAFNRYQTQQQNVFNRLSGVAGTGQQATNFTDTAGANAAAQGANYMTSGAAAGAAGTVGSANAINGGISSGLNYWQGQQALNALKSNPYQTGYNSLGSTGPIGGTASDPWYG